ncbi:MAG TPA: hypothetical protein VFZ73_11855 [Gemmatimonadaceae bacterium]
MLAVVALSLALQVTVKVNPQTREDSLARRKRDSLSVVIQESIRRSERDRRTPRRDSLTPELERSAFIDSGARTLLHRAREARMRQDSTLQSYDAKAYQRISVGLGFRVIGRDRLLARTEVSSRVRWSRGTGALVEITGERAVAPAFGGTADFEPQMTTPVPYYPGREALWIGGNGLARAEVDDRELVHPIAIGSEAYYRYSSGDSLIFTLSDGARITLRELRVEPRRPEWRLSVGSFWFDASSGQLVRAVYRFSAPMDIWAVAKEESQRSKQDPSRRGGMNELRELEEEEDVPGWVRGMMSPLKANLEAVTIEYGLFGGRFWLPRTQSAVAHAQVSFARIPVRIEESFSYNSVNGPETLAALPPPPKSIWDSLFAGDTTPRRNLSPEERRRRNREVARVAGEVAERRERLRREECEKTGSYTRDWDRHEGALRMAVRVPCDSTVLATSPDLPESIYDSGEDIFGTAERDELLKALDFSLQSGWAPQPVLWQYGLAQTRYNRVEGLSSAITGSTELGKGYSLDGSLRLGTGDWSPNAELGIARSNGRTTWRLGAYQRLSVANDWGAPLSFGAGLGALLFGRDDGFYYRSGGIEATRTVTSGSLTTRFFAEHQTEAEVTTGFSVARAFGTPSRFVENIVATRGNALGVSLRDVRSAGLDPQGWRAFSEVRLEGGYFAPSADSLDADLYARAAADVTVSRGLGDRAAASLTVGAGIADKAPVQRRFLLGGTETVRGQRPGTQTGDSYWLTRLELGRGIAAARGVVFGDIGWAGPRELWSHPGRPMSGAGIGVSFMDGLVRADLARGIYPSKRFRFDLYVEARF